MSSQPVTQLEGQSDVAAFLGMMTTACDRLASVENKVGNVPLINQSLMSLVKGQEKMETTVERIEQAQRDAQIQFERQFYKQLGNIINELQQLSESEKDN